MERPEKLPRELVHLYNEFVVVCDTNAVLFEKIDIGIGETEDHIKGLSFDFETNPPLTDEQAKGIFDNYIKRYPQCSITYAKREMSVLESKLRDLADTTIDVYEGFKLERIN